MIENLFDEVAADVERGMKGLNAGIPFGKGLQGLTDYLHGITKGQFRLLGGNTGTGKTALADQMFVIGPLEFLEQNPEFPYTVHYNYYTMEISTKRKLTKWACWKLLRDYNILIDSDTILSKSYKNTLSQETFELFMKTRDWMENLQKFITFREHGSPQSISTNTVNYFANKGHHKDVVEEKNGIKTKKTVFIHNNPNDILFNIEDHIGLLAKDSGITDKKANIDRFSSNTVANRNYYGASDLAISQFNRELGDVGRKRFSELTPQLEDFKDTGNTQEDADAVFALFEPKRYNLTDYKKYNLKYLENWFRMFFVLKNRDGSAGGYKALRFLGECGEFEELPHSGIFVDNPNLAQEIHDKIKNVTRAK